MIKPWLNHDLVGITSKIPGKTSRNAGYPLLSTIIVPYKTVKKPHNKPIKPWLVHRDHWFAPARGVSRLRLFDFEAVPEVTATAEAAPRRDERRGAVKGWLRMVNEQARLGSMMVNDG